MDQIIDLLKQNKDVDYKEFQSPLIPSISSDDFIGVRTPALRKIAKIVEKDDICEKFLLELPHRYFEENQLHAFIASDIKDFADCVGKVELFLPYVDNWATCDQMSPKVFKKHKDELLPYIYRWLESQHTYTVRFGIGMLMKHYLDEDFKEEYVRKVCSIKSDEYYINMEIAWYLATALAKKWDSTFPYIKEGKLGVFVQNKTIQKARESFRITYEQKLLLKEYKK